jgi:predicted AAA+ superfamily ATPase
MELPKKQSAFLWGARKTGKSTYLKTYFPQSVYYDLLKSDIYLRFAKHTSLFREEILALSAQDLEYPIIIDEVQKVPLLLDEVHWLIENTEASFILCGSSARKLKQSGVNLLGGRAWSYHFYPLVYPELTDFNLLKVLNCGTIPSHYTTTNIKKSLKAYIEDYLTQEIKAEGLVRNLPAFARFLDSIGFSHGEMTNYSNIARECGVDSKTVKEYYQILIDTLLGYYIYPYHKRVKRDIILSTPKFYLFDIGVANALARRTLEVTRGASAGKAFEHFIMLELMAYKHLNDCDFNITYWRTKTGLEVDFILSNAEIAIEVKVSDRVRTPDLKGIVAFAEEHQPRASYIVALEPVARKVTLGSVEIMILPYEKFLKALWAGEIIT